MSECSFANPGSPQYEHPVEWGLGRAVGPGGALVDEAAGAAQRVLAPLTAAQGPHTGRAHGPEGIPTVDDAARRGDEVAHALAVLRVRRVRRLGAVFDREAIRSLEGATGRHA